MVSDRSEADSRWKQVEDLFFAAADLPENERAAFLDRTCADDPNSAVKQNRSSPEKAPLLFSVLPYSASRLASLVIELHNLPGRERMIS